MPWRPAFRRASSRPWTPPLANYGASTNSGRSWMHNGKPMKVLVVLLWPKFEFGLEVLHNELDAGSDVTVMECHQELLGCWGNPTHRLSYCDKCCRLRALGTSLVPQRFRRTQLMHLTDADRQRIERLPTRFQRLDALRELVVDGFDVGEAVAP